MGVALPACYLGNDMTPKLEPSVLEWDEFFFSDGTVTAMIVFCSSCTLRPRTDPLWEAFKNRRMFLKTLHMLMGPKWKTGWWFGTFFIFPYIGNNHPNWLSYFSEGFKPPTRKWFMVDPRTVFSVHLNMSFNLWERWTRYPTGSVLVVLPPAS